MDLNQFYVPTDEVQPTLLGIDEIINLCSAINDMAFHMLPFVTLCEQPVPSRVWIMQSVLGTLTTIRYCVTNVCFGDAYALLRKYEDDLFLILYHECVIDNLLPKEDQSIKQILEIYKQKQHGHPEKLTRDEKRVRDWSCNQQKRLGFDDVFDSILKNPAIKEINERFKLRKKLKDLRLLLNDHMHTNGIKFLNRIQISGPDRHKKVRAASDQFLHDIQVITLVYLSFLSIITPPCIMAPDYFDFFECGMTPPEGAQYWVSPLIAQFINSHQSLLGTGLLDYLEVNTPMCFRKSL